MVGDFAYGFGSLLKEIDFDEVVERVTHALREQGFGVLTEIDVKATLEKKLAVDFRRCVILGACSPSLAYQALKSDPHIGLLLPCNVVVQEMNGGDVGVSVASPGRMLRLAGNPHLRSISEEAESRLRRAIQSLDGWRNR